MESLMSSRDHLKDLQSRTKELVETGLALDALFAGEETRLRREDEISRLRAVRGAIVSQLQRLRELELLARCGHGETKLVMSLVGLVVTAVVSTSKPLTAVVGRLVDGLTDREQPFGLVMVCIGPDGLPEDVGVISISRLARESNRPQPEVMSKLRENDYLLLTEEAFSVLIDRLVGDVRAGKLQLPVSRDKLVEITALIKSGSRIKVIEVE